MIMLAYDQIPDMYLFICTINIGDPDKTLSYSYFTRTAWAIFRKKWWQHFFPNLVSLIFSKTKQIVEKLFGAED